MAQEHGHGGLRTYLMVGAALAMLTAISFLAGSNDTIMKTPALGWTIMMAVSCCKALLVMLFFMHLISEEKVILWLLGLCASFLVVLFIIPLAMDLGIGPLWPL